MLALGGVALGCCVPRMGVYIGLGARGKDSRSATVLSLGGVAGSSLSTGIGRGPAGFVLLSAPFDAEGRAGRRLSGMPDEALSFGPLLTFMR